MDQGMDNCMAFLDASKAFDKIWYKGANSNKLVLIPT
jgi:hypothetical protein